MSGSMTTVIVGGAFAITGMACVIRAFWRGDAVRRVGAVIHLVASIVMISMLWTRPVAMVTEATAVAFAVAACWYAYRAWSARGARTQTVSRHADVPVGHHDAAGPLVYHAAMMVVMTWMILSMPGAMAGMPMEPSSPMEGMTIDQQSWLTQGLGAALILAAAWFVIRLATKVTTTPCWDRRSAAVAIDTTIDLGMAAGMAAMTLTMMA